MRFAIVAGLVAGVALVGNVSAQELDFVAPQVRVVTPWSGSYLGVGVADINADRAKALKLKEERGVEITRVEDNSPAAKAGLKTGDVVLEYNGQRLEGTEQFVRMVRETPEGRQVRLVVSRDGSTETVTATVTARKGSGFFYGEPFDNEKFRVQMDKLQQQLRSMPDIPHVTTSWQSGSLGVVAEPLESQLAEYFGVKEGVLVRSVSKDSAAEKAGVKAGDVILKIDEAKVTTPREITNAIRNLGSKSTFPVTVVRNHKEMSVSVTVSEHRGETPPAPPKAPRAPKAPKAPVRPAAQL